MCVHPQVHAEWGTRRFDSQVLVGHFSAKIFPRDGCIGHILLIHVIDGNLHT